MCERFLFDGEMQYSLIEKLSGGEKRRLALLKVLMGAPNVLILDEPTNDLDIQTLQILEDYLDRFAGIVLVVSHDRYFLDRVVTRIFAFQSDGTLWQSEGGYMEYREHCGETGRDLLFREEGRDSSAQENSAGTGKSGVPEGGNSSGKQNRQNRVRKKKLSFSDQREYEHIEEEIEALEQKSAELEKQMEEAATDYGRLAEISREKEETDARLDERLNWYIELQELVEELEKQN